MYFDAGGMATDSAPQRRVEQQQSPNPPVGSDSTPDVFAVAEYDNESEWADELAFSRGDLLRVMDGRHGADWWLCADRRGRTGIAPANRLRLLGRRLSATSDFGFEPNAFGFAQTDWPSFPTTFPRGRDLLSDLRGSRESMATGSLAGDVPDSIDSVPVRGDAHRRYNRQPMSARSAAANTSTGIPPLAHHMRLFGPSATDARLGLPNDFGNGLSSPHSPPLLNSDAAWRQLLKQRVGMMHASDQHLFSDLADEGEYENTLEPLIRDDDFLMKGKSVRNVPINRSGRQESAPSLNQQKSSAYYNQLTREQPQNRMFNQQPEPTQPVRTRQPYSLNSGSIVDGKTNVMSRSSHASIGGDFGAGDFGPTKEFVKVDDDSELNFGASQPSPNTRHHVPINVTQSVNSSGQTHTPPAPPQRRYFNLFQSQQQRGTGSYASPAANTYNGHAADVTTAPRVMGGVLATPPGTSSDEEHSRRIRQPTTTADNLDTSAPSTVSPLTPPSSTDESGKRASGGSNLSAQADAPQSGSRPSSQSNDSSNRSSLHDASLHSVDYGGHARSGGSTGAAPHKLQHTSVLMNVLEELYDTPASYARDVAARSGAAGKLPQQSAVEQSPSPQPAGHSSKPAAFPKSPADVAAPTEQPHARYNTESQSPTPTRSLPQSPLQQHGSPKERSNAVPGGSLIGQLIEKTRALTHRQSNAERGDKAVGAAGRPSAQQQQQQQNGQGLKSVLVKPNPLTATSERTSTASTTSSAPPSSVNGSKKSVTWGSAEDYQLTEDMQYRKPVSNDRSAAPWSTANTSGEVAAQSSKQAIPTLRPFAQRLSDVEREVETAVRTLTVLSADRNWRAPHVLQANLADAQQAVDDTCDKLKAFVDMAESAHNKELDNMLYPLKSSRSILFNLRSTLSSNGWSLAALSRPHPEAGAQHDALDQFVAVARHLPHTCGRIALVARDKLADIDVNSMPQAKKPVVSTVTPAAAPPAIRTLTVDSRTGAHIVEEHEVLSDAESLFDDYDFIEERPGKRKSKTLVENEKMAQNVGPQQARNINEESAAKKPQWPTTPAQFAAPAQASPSNGSAGAAAATKITSDQSLVAEDQSIVKFYAPQIDQHMEYLSVAIEDFFTAIEERKPPQEFVQKSKMVILAAHKLVYIGDNVSQCVKDSRVSGDVRSLTDALCGALKESVASTKRAAEVYPDLSAVQTMVDSMVAVSRTAHQLKQVAARYAAGNQP